MLKLAPVTRMTMTTADTFLQTHFTDLADSVEDYELRGYNHHYYLDDGYEIVVNKHRAILRQENRHDVTTLAQFGQ